MGLWLSAPVKGCASSKEGRNRTGDRPWAGQGEMSYRRCGHSVALASHITVAALLPTVVPEMGMIALCRGHCYLWKLYLSRSSRQTRHFRRRLSLAKAHLAGICAADLVNKCVLSQLLLLSGRILSLVGSAI